MEKYTIAELRGVNRNAVEGVTDAPSVAQNVQFKRAGGYVPLGGERSDWLGERSLSAYVLEDGDFILYEEGDIIYSEWQPSADFGLRELLAQDEALLAVVGGPRVWFQNNLLTVSPPAWAEGLTEDVRLSLAPRAAVLSSWRQVPRQTPVVVDREYVGGVFYANRDNEMTAGLGPGTLTFTPTAGSGIAAANYEFIWTVEAPTNAGLVVHAVGVQEYTLSAAASQLDVAFDQVWEEGSVVRLFYREDVQPIADGYEEIGVAVCDGLNTPTIVLGPLGTFLPTDFALVNFAPGRLEAHNGRIWGAAAKDALVPLTPDAGMGRFGGYMSVASGDQFTVRQVGDVDVNQMGLTVAGDYVELDIAEFRVRRTHRTLPIVVELFRNEHQNSTEQFFAFLQWDVGVRFPKFVAYFTDGTTYHKFAEQLIELSLLDLGLTINSEVLVKNMQLRFAIVSVNFNIAGSITSLGTLTVSVGTPPTTFTADTAVVGTDTAAATAWIAYSGLNHTFLYLGALPANTGVVPTGVLGNRYLNVRSIETGNASSIAARGDINDYDPSTDFTTWTSTSGGGNETWTTTTLANMFVDYRPATPDLASGPRIIPSLTLVYSNVGSVNRGTVGNFLPYELSPLSSTEITGLASTPAGLLVFFENETFLVRGDNELGNLESQRLTGTMGNDPGVIPARLGSVVFPIYQGEIYAVNLGGGDVDFGGAIANISRDVWRPTDPFVQVVGEPTRNHLVALTTSGASYRFDAVVQQWVTDLFSDVVDLRYLIGANVDRRFGVRYNVQGFLEVVDSDLVGPITVGWSALDMGDKNLMKLWRRVEVYTKGLVGVPTLSWSGGARAQSVTVGGIDNGGGRWVFTLPRGLVDVNADLSVEFVGAGQSFEFEPPVVIDFAPRYRQR